MMNHKERMKQLKENDPITYYSLTDNPCGVNSDGTGIEVVVIILIIAFCFYLFCGN